MTDCERAGHDIRTVMQCFPVCGRTYKHAQVDPTSVTGYKICHSWKVCCTCEPKSLEKYKLPAQNSVKKTITLNLSDKEMDALEILAAQKDVSKTAIMRQALRLYQMFEQKMTSGHRTIIVDKDGKEVRMELML